MPWIHGRVLGNAALGKAAGIAAHVQDFAGLIGKNNLEGILKGVVRVIMVEAEPAFLRLLRKGGKALVNGGPGAKLRQTGRTAFLEGFFQVEKAQVIDVLVKVHVHLCGCVRQQEPAGFGEMEFVLLVDNDRTNGKRCFQQDFGGIDAEPCLLGDFRRCSRRFPQHFQDSQLEHKAAHLEYNGPEGDVFRETLRFACAQMILRICFFYAREEMHLLGR